FYKLSAAAKVSSVQLTDFSPFAPVPGNVSRSFSLAVKPISGTAPVTASVSVGLRVGDAYQGDGSDLRLLQWLGTNWQSTPFSYSANTRQVATLVLTNLSAFVVSQYTSPSFAAQAEAGGFRFSFTPQAYVTYTLQRSAVVGPAASWTTLSSVTPTNTQTAVLHDDAPVGAQAFYRLQLSP